MSGERASLDGDLLVQVVDHVMAILPPYETSVYLYLLRHSHLNGSPTVRVGKRTIGEGLGKGTRSRRANYQHIDEKLRNLARGGFITVGDTDRTGTLYTVTLPTDVPAVRAQTADERPAPAPDYFRDPTLRRELFERDAWSCQYCGEHVTPETATLDHVTPTSLGGTDAPGNLTTACLMCNSIKSGRAYDAAASDLLTALRSRRTSSGSVTLK